jgi:hypothetical protein
MQPTPSPVLLEYRHDPAARRAHGIDWLFFLLGLPALVALFVPFTFGVSPASVLHEMPKAFAWTRWEPDTTIVMMTLPLFLPVSLSVLRLRLLLWGDATRGERWVCYALAAAGAAAVVALLGVAVAHRAEMDWRDRGVFAAAGIVLTAGAIAMALIMRRAGDRDARALAAMLVPYIADCAICLIAFRDDAQLGWYLTAVSAPAAVAEIVLLVFGYRRTGAT